MKPVITVIDGKVTVISMLFDGVLLQAVAGYHPSFDLIHQKINANEALDKIAPLFDIEKAVRNTFKQYTERVSIRNGEVLVDGDSRQGTIAKQILATVEDGHLDRLEALVHFMEKVEQNPNENSRAQLFDWLDRHKFTLTADGDIVGYKGVRKDEQGNFTSISQGPGIVNGKEVNGYVPNPLGATVEIARSKVDSNPRAGCSTGLHVGTWEYAKGFARGAVLEVHVNPRDVVSVPSDCNFQKVRACRYKVVKVVTERYTAPVLERDDDDNAKVAVTVDKPVAPVKPISAEVFKAVTVDTRDNHKKQQRYPKGHPKAGQFIPKGAKG
jgi:hypothetical protein